MRRLIDAINAVKSHVFGICRVKNVVVGIVAGMPMHALRALDARYLLARVLRCWVLGRLTPLKCHARPVACGATWSPEPTSSGLTGARLARPLSRSRSATPVIRF